MQGQPKNLDRSAPADPDRVRTEPLFSDGEHDVFFNRGVASSQAYAREFGNKKPDRPADRGEARARRCDWLSRDLDEAHLQVHRRSAKRRHAALLLLRVPLPAGGRGLKAAIDRGVDVRLIVDAKENADTDKKGKFHAELPARGQPADASTTAKHPARRNVILREARASDIQHNKFMVCCKGKAQKPTEVWTGSTNISPGGIHGQTNVGHWVRDARRRRSVPGLLGAADDRSRARADGRRPRTTMRRRTRRFATRRGALAVPTTLDDDPGRHHRRSSARAAASTVLDLYAAMLDEAEALGCITLAFGVSDGVQGPAATTTPRDSHAHLPAAREEGQARTQAAKTAVRAAQRDEQRLQGVGLLPRDPVYQWARETNAGLLGLNTHVTYIHSKFLLMDPLGADPIVVTGSANFSDASTNDNDENMLIIRGDQRVADIYFTEFNRLFNHYYFRSVQEATARPGDTPKADNAERLFLGEKRRVAGEVQAGKAAAKAGSTCWRG